MWANSLEKYQESVRDDAEMWEDRDLDENEEQMDVEE
jgi:hypothetical protein